MGSAAFAVSLETTRTGREERVFLPETGPRSITKIDH
jgi:hypothetical protein